MIEICKDGKTICEMKHGCLYFIDAKNRITEATNTSEVKEFFIENGQLGYEKKEVKNEIH